MALMDENGGMVMPVAPLNNGGGFGGDWGSWIILFLIFGMFNGGWGNGFNGGGYEFPWLFNGQQNINANTNAGFRDAMLNDGITSIQSGINGISTQLCNGFAGVEQGANARQIANMQTAFANQTAMMQGFGDISSQLANCCCDNRLATCQTQNIIQNEGNATRFSDATNTRDIIDSQTRGTQAILDKLCALELDAKNDTIAQLRQELLYARGQASQDVQTAVLRQGQNDEVDALYNRLNNCPVNTVPVYGRQPIFSVNSGCACGM